MKTIKPAKTNKKKTKSKKDIVQPIPDTPENIARALFGLKPSEKQVPKPRILQ